METDITYRYPDGTVRALLKTDQVTAATRRVLTERLTSPARQPTFFTTAEFDLLRRICDRLVPQTDRTDPIDIAGGIDERLTQNKSNGWRYDVMPNDRDAYRKGLAGVDESSLMMFGEPFKSLTDEKQDQVLSAVQRIEAPGEIWSKLPAERFFEELLAEAVETYYSHPMAQEEIGYVGMADVPTWQRIGLNNLEKREPKPFTNR
ncbi:gluconate 2-dehydrogenase subunit 3 family protein [Spirosoma sp. KNUC1025]|uniref:gluconate 2-dehydrogenase subunit 3 family protein n=1 Tax=Spirosoma sp. KNUC1025 TaxID=2894082 RepID=UPI00386A6345|nr:gluconate 2-dehydrogenase subunit 3 family protein [Spirosoma sp. KNUC1025]